MKLKSTYVKFKLCKDEKNEIFISIISGYIYCSGLFCMVSSPKDQKQGDSTEKQADPISIYNQLDHRHKPKSEDVIKTVVPEDARPKFKPVGKIDLDKISGRRTDKVEKAPEKKVEPVVEQPV